MKIFRNVVLVILIVVVTIGIRFVGLGYSAYKEALNNMPLEEKVAVIQSKENYTKIDEMPKMYRDAAVAVEDHRFYMHNGIDIISIGRAVVNDVKAMKFVEGGSTITQQLAKNIYFTQEKKMTRKIAEAFMAFKIESSYDKDEILELYLNTSYFGDGYYTAKEACEGYFNKKLNEMTDYEAILLAGIPNAPSVYAPTKNQELAKKRQKQVMDKMVKYKILTEEEEQRILNQN